VAGSCKHVNEPSGPIKGREFLDLLIVLLASQEELCSMELVTMLNNNNNQDNDWWRALVNTLINLWVP
jgi:hypothetical protein